MPAIDTVPTNSSRVDYPAEDAFAVTPHASNELTYVTRALYVGTGGTLDVVMANGSSAVSFTNVPSGSIIPIRVKAVRATSTASGIVGLV